MSEAFNRNCGLGGSDAAAALGIVPYKTSKTPVDLWLEKTGKQAVSPAGEEAEWGNYIQGLIAMEYEKRNGVVLTQYMMPTYKHSVHPWMYGHVDGMVYRRTEEGSIIRDGGPLGVFEAKLAGPHTMRDWGEESDGVPIHYLVQCYHYLAVTGLPWCDVAVLLGGVQYRQYRVERDEALIEQVEEGEAKFWECVRRDVPPALMPGDADKLWRKSAAVQVVADSTTQGLCAELAKAKFTARIVERSETIAGDMIKRAMGTADTLVDAEGKVLATWKTSKGRRKFNEALFRSDHPDLAEEYTYEERGARPFLLKVKAEAEDGD